MKYKVIARNSISIVGVMGPFDSYKTAHAEAQHLADKVGHKKDVEVLLLDEKGMKSHGIDPEVQAIEDFNAFEKSGAFGPVQLRQNPTVKATGRTRRFDGKDYGLWSRVLYKSMAEAIARRLREQDGRAARVTKETGEYAVWRGPKLKRNPEKSVKTYKVDGVPFVRVYRDTDYDEYSVVALSSKGRPVESSRYFADSRSDALATAERMLDEVSRKANPGHDWIGEVDQEIEDDGTEGAFTRQARRAGYKNTMEFARKVMKGWRSGKKTVYNKRTKKQQRITKKTMNRANFAINAQKRRRNPSDDRPDPLSFVYGTLPSEYRRGKVSHDDDYRAGYRAGKKWAKQHGSARITPTDIKELYRPLDNIHGDWWIDGFGNAIEIERGIAPIQTELVAYRLGLIRNNPQNLKFSFDESLLPGVANFKSGPVGKVGRIEVSIFSRNPFYAYLYSESPNWVSMRDYITVNRTQGYGGEVPYATKEKVYKAASKALSEVTGLPITQQYGGRLAISSSEGPGIRNPLKTPDISDVVEVYRWGKDGPETVWLTKAGRGRKQPLGIGEIREVAAVLEREGVNFDSVDWTTMGDGKINRQSYSLNIRLLPGTYRSGPIGPRYFENPSHETPSYLQLSGPMLEEVSELTNQAKRDMVRAKTIQELYTAYYRALDQINTRWRLHTPTMRKTLKRDFAAGDEDVIAYVQKSKSLADEARALAAFASNRAWEMDAEADSRRLRAEEEMFDRHYYLLREIMGHDPALFARRNPHLVVGETAKFSDQFMQWLEKYGSQYYTPYQIEDFTQAYQTGAEFDVEAQIPGGYEVYDGNKYGGGGPERRHADESLVAGDSLSTDWPGDNFEGIPPHRTGS